MIIHADKIAQRLNEIQSDDKGDETRKHVPISLRIVGLTENITARYRVATKEEKLDYAFAINLLTQALVYAKNNDKTNAQKLMALARRVAK